MKKGQIKGNTYKEFETYFMGYTSNGHTFKVSKEDIDVVKNYTWCVKSEGYIQTNINKKNVELHSFLFTNNEGMEIDHINHDKSDNRRENLRVCTKSQNQHNALIRKDNVSGYKGVNFKKVLNKWRAYIQYNKKLIHLGYFEDIEDAINARKNAEEKYFGEYRLVL